MSYILKTTNESKSVSRGCLHKRAFAWVLLGLLSANFASAEVLLNKQVTVDVAPQSMGSALLQFGAQTGLQIMTEGTSVSDKTSPGVKGTLPVGIALSTLLDDSGLSFRERQGAVLVVPAAIMSAVTAATALTLSSAEGSRTPSAELPVPGDASDASPDQWQDQERPRAAQLQQVVVTGSRLQTSETPQEVETYTHEAIDRTGLSDVGSFLNTLPQVSVSSSDSYFGSKVGAGAATTVQLHGLPMGTTLVLINGRRVETTGSTQSSDVFDLSTIPIAAVDRIEVVPSGASAIYGSDAIAGVVNIILKTDFTGVEVDGKYSWAKDLPQWDSSIGLGKQWERGSVSLIGTFLNRGSTNGFDRSFSDSDNFTPQGGSDVRYPVCPLANVYFPNGYTINGQVIQNAAVPAGYKGSPTVAEFAGTAGTQNRCSLFSYNTTVPQLRREGGFLSGHYDLTDDIQVFTEILYSQYDATQVSIPNFLYGSTVPGSNAYNPFGQNVKVNYLLTDSPYARSTHTSLFRPVIGVRGTLGPKWSWELTGMSSRDHEDEITPYSNPTPALQAALASTNPATALNPFGTGAPGSQQLIASLYSPDRENWTGQLTSASAFLRGDAFSLPAGAVQVVAGSEFDHSLVNFIEIPSSSPFTSFSRTNYAVFGESHIPILSTTPTQDGRGDYLSVTAAGRYDHFSDFGGKGTPQVGLVWQPVPGLAFRANYGQAFKAPTLVSLYSPQITTPDSEVIVNGQAQYVTELNGGNPNLKAETSTSHTFGLAYSGEDIPGLSASITNWEVDLKNDIQSLSAQTILENPALFSQYITHAADGTISEVNSTYVNFGEIRVGGMDYAASYKMKTGIGTFTPSLQATGIYHYTSALAPGSPAINVNGHGQDSGVWAPHWKGTAALQWTLRSLAIAVDGRFVGPYQDYDRSVYIGDFWLADFNVHYSVDGLFKRMEGSFIDAGIRNAFNRQPQFSTFYDGLVGYDPTQADFIGRLMYVKLGVRL